MRFVTSSLCGQLGALLPLLIGPLRPLRGLLLGQHRPPSEWVVVPNAHPAVISMEEAEAIMLVGGEQRRVGSDKSRGRMAAVRAHGSPHLLTGGLLVCKRCGANMVSHRSKGRSYYVCGSHQYRRGLGCGQALYVRQADLDGAVIAEVGMVFDVWCDAKRLAELVNEELRARRQAAAAGGAAIGRRLEEVEREMGNIRRAVKAGLDDLEWANQELARLRSEKASLQVQLVAVKEREDAVVVDAAQVAAYRRQFHEVLACGGSEAKREITSAYVRRVEVEPATGDVWMHLYGGPPQAGRREPSPAGGKGSHNGLVAGAGFVPDWYSQRLPLVAARWVYALANRGAREMQRIGLWT